METGETASQAEKPSLPERIIASDEFAEITAGFVMSSWETWRFMISDPEAQIINLNPEHLPSTPTEAVESWVFQHIGDVWEVAYLFTATRLAVAGLNEAFKKVTKKEIPEEARFWASLVTSVTIPSLMELNIMSLFGEKINSSSDPGDLFGVGVGACVITAAHYASKYREPIKKMASMAASKASQAGEKVAEKMKKIEEKLDSLAATSGKDDQLARN